MVMSTAALLAVELRWRTASVNSSWLSDQSGHVIDGIASWFVSLSGRRGGVPDWR